MVNAVLYFDSIIEEDEDGGEVIKEAMVIIREDLFPEYYKAIINDMKEKGFSEETITSKMGTPEELRKRFGEGIPEKKPEETEEEGGKWLQFFEQVSCYYREMYMIPLWDKYPKYTSDIWDSLAIFLDGYAFERQGRRPDYFHAAVDALFYCKQQNNGNLTQNVVNDIWQRFRESLENQNLNHQNNPLYPSTDLDNRQRLGNKSSVIEVVIGRNISPSFSTYIQKQINQDNDTQDAFNLLNSVRGIGGKIASFYLRDLVNIMNINLANVQNRFLLQPIDIWIERTVKKLAKDPNMSKNQVANWIVSNSDQPERVNMGIWFFCSKIVGSEYKLKKVLENFNIAQSLVNGFKIGVKNACRSC